MRPVVLYITGMMRCGSTFVGNVLNELPGAVHIGERYFLWKNAVLRDGTNTLCGCGLDLLDCDVWAKHLGGASGPDRKGAERLWDLQQRFLRTRHTAPRLAESLGRRRRPSEVDELGDAIAEVHHAVAAGSGAEVIVDSSKYAADAAVLTARDDLDVRVLHIVRDPRATVTSYLAPKNYLERMSAPRTLGYWAGFNVASEAVGAALDPAKYLRIRYEDFTRRPRAVTEEIARFAGYSDASAISFDSDTSVVLGANHTVTGNPDRLRHGRIEIQQRERWRDTMPLPGKLAAFAGVAPLMLRYGYR
ncbi:sulfotransferase [Amycolatopsis minnesotensis]|uniref:Sulfotransferase n=1 Tax=Amycolatopsis minnesotensis TaxID=337894 RepID=A0ABN2RSS6_9PSEU